MQEIKIWHTIKWYTHKLESVLENKIHKIVWDFEIQTNHLIMARISDSVNWQTKKSRRRRERFWRFWPSGRPESENKRKRKFRQILGLSQKLKRLEPEGRGNTNYSWCTQNVPQILPKEFKESKISGRIETIQTSIAEISLNTQKNFGDVKRLAVTQTPIEDHQLMLVWKTYKWNDNVILIDGLILKICQPV